MDRPVEARPGVAQEFFAGVRMLGRGLAMWSTAPRLMIMGALPALVVAVVFVVLFVVLAVNVTAIAEWLTPFARGWGEALEFAAVTLVSVGIVVIAGLALVYTFTALTLLVGDVFYEKIWASVETRLGGGPAAETPGFWRSLWRSTSDSLRILLVTVGASLAVVLTGLVPVVGGVLVPVLSAIVGGWFLAVELTARAFDSRGFTLTERRRLLRSRRAFALGFGVATYLMFLIPLGAVAAMPAAVVGGTLVARDTLDRSGASPRRQLASGHTAAGAPKSVRTPGE
ncbi:EI24 domain-containing protein [Marisediminicola sp. LYQ85]|uniref:EI24 domain-containing protein n=1 Tax=Marisediminicola sp. LYQ85 TaxID=3391062 RepID=UPI00398364B9